MELYFYQKENSFIDSNGELIPFKDKTSEKAFYQFVEDEGL